MNNNNKKASVGKDVEKLVLLYTVGAAAKENSMEVLQKIKNRTTI